MNMPNLLSEQCPEWKLTLVKKSQEETMNSARKMQKKPALLRGDTWASSLKAAREEAHEYLVG